MTPAIAASMLCLIVASSSKRSAEMPVISKRASSGVNKSTLGDHEGDSDGDSDGLKLGLSEGDSDGDKLGLSLGLVDGLTLGLTLGDTDGLTLGETLGDTDGLTLGDVDGAIVHVVLPMPLFQPA
tara:strand:- start:131 stop:505 length:375 start_codon:yes stop_codon:yes gene_type:complete